MKKKILLHDLQKNYLLGNFNTRSHVSFSFPMVKEQILINDVYKCKNIVGQTSIQILVKSEILKCVLQKYLTLCIK